MPDDIFHAPKTSRLSFKPNRDNTVLLDERSLDEFFLKQAGNEDVRHLVFPIGLYDNADQAVVLERLKRLGGWLPILVCPDDMDLSCTVVSAWVEERDALIVWSRFAFGVGGEYDKIDVSPIIFDRDEYLDFIREVRRRAGSDYLVEELCPNSSATGGCSQPEKYDPEAALNLLSRLIFESAGNEAPPVKKFWAKYWRQSAALASCLLIIAVFILSAVVFKWPFHISAAAIVGVFAISVSPALIRPRFTRETSDFRPPVFLVEDGFLVGWSRKLIPWSTFAGFLPDVGDPSATEEEVLTIEDSGRINFKPTLLGDSKGAGHYLSALNAALFALIESRKPCPPTPTPS